MSRQLPLAILSGVCLSAGLLVFPGSFRAANRQTRLPGDDSVQIEMRNPFTRFAQIPADADLSSVHFERLRQVQMPTRIKRTIDNDCLRFASAEPGNAAGCAQTQVEVWAPAYEVSYSYRALPQPTDETAGEYYTFQVYFRPGELDEAIRQAAADRHEKRHDVAAYFALSTSRETLTKAMIDEKRSRFCDGTLIDGDWAQRDPDCHDQLSYKTVRVPSPDITVRADPTASRRATAAADWPIGNGSGR